MVIGISNSIDMSQLINRYKSYAQPVNSNAKVNETDVNLSTQDGIIDTSVDYGSFMNQRGINSLEEYKFAREMQLRNKMLPSLHELPQVRTDPSLSEEFGKQQSLYEKTYSSIDFEQEYKDYMESRGCKNEDELQALNKTFYKTTDELRSAAASGMTSIMMNVAMRNPEMVSSLHDINSIVSSLNVNSLANYMNSMYAGFESNGRALQALLAQADGEGIDTGYLEKISASIDTMFKQVKEEEELNRQGQTVNFDKYQEAYKQKLMAQYGR